MSWKSDNWAIETGVFPSSHRFVLLVLAKYCSDTGKSYPSVDTISEDSGLHEQTVRVALKALEDSRFIADTGKRTGSTGQIKVYQLPDAAWKRSPKSVRFEDTVNPVPFDGKGTYKTSARLVQDTVNTDSCHIYGTGNIEHREKGASLPLAVVLEAWNKLQNVPHCLLLSDKRRKSLAARLKEPFFLTNWQSALERVDRSAFCAGQSERGWKATFDWFITPDAVIKIMEGKYDGPANQTEQKAASYVSREIAKINREIASI